MAVAEIEAATAFTLAVAALRPGAGEHGIRHRKCESSRKRQAQHRRDAGKSCQDRHAHPLAASRRSLPPRPMLARRKHLLNSLSAGVSVGTRDRNRFLSQALSGKTAECSTDTLR
jgi:hypothetical protein